MEHYYIIKTKDGEFVKTYATHNFYMEPEEFWECGFDWRRWKPEEVEVVEYPTKHGQKRSYKYVGVDIKIKKEEERKEQQTEADFEKEIASICKTYGITEHLDAELGPLDIKNIARHFYELGLNARKEK